MFDSLTPPAERVGPQSLKKFNTFGIEAQAQSLLILNAIDQLDSLRQKLLNDSKLQAGQALHVLGGGSNLLISHDISSVVLKIELMGIECISSQNDTKIVRAAAGEHWHPFVRTCLANGWNGLENLSLIPGTVGASPIQNIGAYGVELKDRFLRLKAWNWRTDEIRIWTLQDCAFAYRDSAFKKTQSTDWIILWVEFSLSSNNSTSTDYADLQAELKLHSIAPSQATPIQVSDAVCAVRSRKLPDPQVLGNAGSFFQNPVISQVQAQALKQKHPAMPQWPVTGPDEENKTKISAAWLIDQCGWKGYRNADVGVHSQHALVLVNYGNASGDQLGALAQEIKADVLARYSVQLEQEPVVWPI